MKVALITSIFGGFDNHKPVMEQSYKHDYFCFTEKSGYLFRDELSNRLRAKWFKYQQHNIKELEKYDAYIWMDGSFEITSPNFVEYMVRQLEGHHLAITLHNKRDCVYQECDYIINSNEKYILDRYGAEKDLMRAQQHDYKAMGFPEHWGLFCGGMFARLNAPVVNQVMDMVWIDNIRYASQDQNPLPLYCWKYNLKVNRLPLDICRNHFWKLKSHQ